MLGDLPVSNGKRSSELPAPLYINRGRVSLQNHGFCLGTYGRTKTPVTGERN